MESLRRAMVAALLAEPRRARTRLILGCSGTGKSRLVHRVADSLREAGLEVVVGPRALTESCDVAVLDDVDRFDDAELTALSELIADRRRIVLAASRPRRRDGVLGGVLADLTVDAPALRLGRLTVDETIAAATAPGAPEAMRLGQAVYARTSGIPCLVDAALVAVREAGGPGGPEAKVAGAAIDTAVDAELRERIAALPEAEAMALALLTLGVEVGTTDIAEVLDVDFERTAQIIDAARCSGLVDAEEAVATAIHRQAVSVLGRVRTAQIELSLEKVLRRTGMPANRLAAKLSVDGLIGSVDSALDAAADLLMNGDIGRVGTVLDPLWDRVDAPQRLRAVDLACVTAMMRGDAERAAGLVDWVTRQDSPFDTAPVDACVRLPDLARRALTTVVCSGDSAALERFAGDDGAPSVAGPDTAGSIDVMVANGVAASLAGPDPAALQILLRAAAAERECLSTRVCADTAAAIAALLAMHTGRLGRARAVLSRMPLDNLPAPHDIRRRLLLGWVTAFEGDLDAASTIADGITGKLTCPRDEVGIAALRVAIARRRGDDAELRAALDAALEPLGEYCVDMFGLIFVGELWVGAAQVGALNKFEAVIERFNALVDTLGPSAQWSVAPHWYGVHAAISNGSPNDLVPHAQALAEAGRTCRQAAVLAQAGRVWIEVLGGTVAPQRVDDAARALDDQGYPWEAARLAGQAALSASDARTTGAMLQLARSLRTHRTPVAESPAEKSDEKSSVAVLSAREREVAILLLLGMTHKNIGERLFISAKTVEHHVARIRRRIGAQDRAEMLTMLRAMKIGHELSA